MFDSALHRDRILDEGEIEGLLRNNSFKKQGAPKKKRILFVAESNDSSSHGVPVVMNNIASVVREQEDYEVYVLVNPFHTEELVLYGPHRQKEKFNSRADLLRRKRELVKSIGIIHVHSPHLSDQFVYFNLKTHNSMGIKPFLKAFENAKIVFTDHSNPTEDLDIITERLGVNPHTLSPTALEELLVDSRLKEHDPRFADGNQWGSGWTPTMILGRGQMYDLADVVTHVSGHQWEYNQWLVPGEHTHQKHQVVYNGIDIARYAQNPSVDVLVEQLRIKYHLQGREEKVLLYAGRATEAKGFYDFLDAAAILKSKLNPCKIKIVLMGDAKDSEESIKRRYECLRDDLIFVGKIRKREEIAAHYKLADIVLQPTRGECFNQVVGEALAMGVPVITSDFSGPKEVYVDRGLAYGVRPQDPQGLAAKITDVLNDYFNAKTMAKHAQRTVLDELSVDAMGNRYLNIYEHLIEETERVRTKRNVHAPQDTLLNSTEYQRILTFLRNGEVSNARRELTNSRGKYWDSISQMETGHLEGIVKTIEGSMTEQDMQKRVGNDPTQGNIVKHERRDIDGRELPLYGLFSIVDNDFMNTFAWKEIAKVALHHYQKPWDAIKFAEYVHLITPSDAEASLIKGEAYVALERPFEAAEEILSINLSKLRGEQRQRWEEVKGEVIPANVKQQCDSFWTGRKVYLNFSTTDAVNAYIHAIERFLLQQRIDTSKAALYLIYELFTTKHGLTPDQKRRLLYLQGRGREQVGDLNAARESLEQALTVSPVGSEEESFYSSKLCDLECKLFAQKFKGNKKEVSYIMPVYNVRLDHLNAAIGSVLSQEGYQQKLELIIVDDGSKENLAAYIKGRYPQEVAEGKIKVTRKKNGGAADARNVALRIALQGGSKYITFLDGDDIAHQQRTKRLVSFLEKHPDMGFVHAKVDFIDQEGNGLPDSSVAHYFKDEWNAIGAGPFDTSTFGKLRTYACPINNQSVIVRADIIKQAGFQNPLWRRGGEDMVYWASIAQVGAQLGFLNEAVANYRLR